MTALTPRRAFLRGLVSLPLIGGGVSLIGNPVRSDVAVTRDLQRKYIAWLANEHAAALIEYGRPDIHHIDHYVWDSYRRSNMAPMYWYPEGHEEIERSVWFPKPSARAAVVLSAAGCDWRGPPT